MSDDNWFTCMDCPTSVPTAADAQAHANATGHAVRTPDRTSRIRPVPPTGDTPAPVVSAEEWAKITDADWRAGFLSSCRARLWERLDFDSAAPTDATLAGVALADVLSWEMVDAIRRTVEQGEDYQPHRDDPLALQAAALFSSLLPPRGPQA
jgi:hypothetical protein